MDISDDAIIDNICCVLSFLLDHRSPLWKYSNKHHSLKSVLSSSNDSSLNKLKKNKKRSISFAKRCATFQSQYNLPKRDMTTFS